MMDAIMERKSVRTYEKRPLRADDLESIGEMIRKIEPMSGPFGHRIRFFFRHEETQLDEEAKKIGTYGYVKNAPAFIGGSIQNTFDAIVDYGYVFEHLILEATKMGFGTVWLGGTFDRSAFAEYVKGNEIIPAITPIGYEADRRFMEKAIRYAIKANSRKPFSALFFQNDAEHPLDATTVPSVIGKALEAVQVGPSASNKQPWRLIFDGPYVHFFLEKTPNYATSMPFSMQALDLGIAICHFELSLKHAKHSYQMKKIEGITQKDWIYILSFVLGA